MEESKQKFVEYDKYCLKCEHLNSPEDEDPCDECLRECVNWDSHKPINFKEKEGKGQSDGYFRRDRITNIRYA